MTKEEKARRSELLRIIRYSVYKNIPTETLEQVAAIIEAAKEAK